MKNLKKCYLCLQDKALSNFSKVGKSQRLCKFCIDCEDSAGAIRLKKKKDGDSSYYISNYEDVREKQIWSRLKTRYGVTQEWFEHRMLQQDGVCAICGKPPTKKRLHVDHNHVTGEPRGLLCVTCNMRVGVIEDHEWLSSAHLYLSTNDESWIREIN